VEKGSPAEKAGVKAGDVIVRVGDEKLSDRGDFSRVMRKHRDGGKLSLVIVRDKHEQTVTLDVPQRHSRDSSELMLNNDDELVDLDASLSSMDDSMADYSVELETLSDDLANIEITDTLQKAKPAFEMLQRSLKTALSLSDSMI
jgi:membrane-associated protease RseP (regulator of RpoE activity)